MGQDAARKESLKGTLESFRQSAAKLPGASPLRLLNAVRTVGLDTTEDDDVPNTLGLEDVLREAARRAARINPDHPLDQARNRKVLWSLFKKLSAASLGKERNGRRGSPSRFEFDPSITCRDLRLAFDELEIQQPARPGTAATPRQRLPAASRAAEQPASPQSLDRDSVVALLQEHAEALRNLGVVTLSIFGSVARNQARPDSDVDVLATFREPITSDAFFATKFFLEDLLGRPVDLLTEAALRDRVRREIAGELVRVA